VRRADNFTTFNLLEPSGPVQACNGIALLLHTDTVYLFLVFVHASLPVDESRTGFRNVVLKKLDGRQNPNKETVSLSHILSSVPYSVEYLRLYSGTIFSPHIITLKFYALFPPGHKFLCSL